MCLLLSRHKVKLRKYFKNLSNGQHFLLKMPKLENLNKYSVYSKITVISCWSETYIMLTEWPKKWNPNAFLQNCLTNYTLCVFPSDWIIHGNFNLENCSHKGAICCLRYVCVLFVVLHSMRRLFSRINKRNSYFCFSVITHSAERMIHLLQTVGIILLSFAVAIWKPTLNNEIYKIADYYAYTAHYSTIWISVHQTVTSCFFVSMILWDKWS